ncbi:hypothetical protein DACRYDRAFT_105327 [Dacryopinax primogenitus]|uniref:DASH complex subunit DUO1 n=1 Tax=Dacryopinax primogenitus (strain DJM 731) TaxID=1858805 RepID=M5G6E6_DACPD|nr:uncharacterized protein DACRYDRAFT_105327 [Dacryopinax primogenitus]EJU04264.1 hypothetical protein DACRYDRAFT_105327 [Dacryopinax primogenitus]
MSLTDSPPTPHLSSQDDLVDLKDLSLSDLAGPDTPRAQKPFSLFAETPDQPPRAQAAGSDQPAASTSRLIEKSIAGKSGLQEEMDGEAERRTRGPRTNRAERLETELFELKQLNQVFSDYLTSLEAAKDHNSRLAAQVDRTNALLDKYVAILGQAQHTQELVLNPEWQGAEADELAILEQRQREHEERVRIAREEKERKEREERERLAKAEREEQEREARERKEAMGSRGRGRGVSGVRGVRGVRGTRGTTTTTAPRGRGVSSTTGDASKPRSSMMPRPSVAAGRGRARP